MSNINVASINMSLMSEKEMLEKSNGVVTSVKPPVIKNSSELSKPYLEINEESIFSESIFGVCKDSINGLKSKVYDPNEDRKRLFGHITLPIPYINPILTQPVNKISIILGCTNSNIIKEIVNYKRFLIKVEKNTKVDNQLLNVSKKHKEEVKKVNFINYLDTLNYNYYTVGLNVFKMDSHLPEEINTIDKLSKVTDMLIGTYAIIMLLQQFDLKTELIKTRDALESLESESENMFYQDNIFKELNRRYNILLNMINNNLDFSDLTHFTVLVIPAKDRDVQLVYNMNKEITLQSSEVNKYYNNLIKASSALGNYNFTLPYSTEILYSDYHTWIRDIPITNFSFISRASFIQEKVNELILEGLQKSVGKKYGIAREEVLSKRSDYSLRGVIVPDPALELDTIGIPLRIIFPIVHENFKKYLKGNNNEVVKELKNIIKSEKYFFDDVESINDIIVNKNYNSESYKIKEYRAEVMETLQDYLDTIRVIMIRFPSLHLFSKLGFKIKLVDGYTIKLHPLVCKPFNADFDGDTMSGYVQFTPESVKEIDENLLPSKKILGSSGEPIIFLSQDAVLGSYFLTMIKDDSNKEPKEYYNSYYDMLADYESGYLSSSDIVSVKYPRYNESIFNYEYNKYKAVKDFNQKDYRTLGNIKLERRIKSFPRIDKYNPKNTEWVTSSVGRFIFNSAVPQDLGYVDRETNPYELEVDKIIKIGINNGQIKDIVQKTIFKKDTLITKFMLDRLKEIGYKNATLSGTSLTLQDMIPPKEKFDIVRDTEELINEKRKNGGISEKEEVAIWQKASEKLSNDAVNELEVDNPLKMMLASGSRGNKGQISQMISMRSIMEDATGRKIPTPVKSSLVDGMSGPEMFIGSYATRKGIYDKGRNTRVTGDATRVMVFGLEDVVIHDGDCGDTTGILAKPIVLDKTTGKKKPLSASIIGKITLEDITDFDRKVVIEKGKPISPLYKDLIDKKYSESGIRVRSPLTCKGKHGICCKCYGYSFNKMRFSKLGDPVGIIAAQSMGEPGTQMTLQTFHTGGQAKAEETIGFAQIKKFITTSQYSNTVNSKYVSRISENKDENRTFMNDVIDCANEVKKTLPKYLENPEIEIGFGSFGIIYGDDLYINLLKNYAQTVDMYYAKEGPKISSVHFEILARATMNNFKVIYAGDTELVIGDIINFSKLLKYNTKMINEGKEPVIVMPIFESTTKLGQSERHVMTSLMFRNIGEAVSRASLLSPVDILDNPMSGTAVANPLPVGENASKFRKVVKMHTNNLKSREELEKDIGVEFVDTKSNEEKIIKEFKPEINWDNNEEKQNIEEIIENNEEDNKENVLEDLFKEEKVEEKVEEKAEEPNLDDLGIGWSN